MKNEKHETPQHRLGSKRARMVESKRAQWHFCPLCERPYSSEVYRTTTSTTDKSTKKEAEVGSPFLNSAVPVQSVVCSHVLCLSCVQQQVSLFTNARIAEAARGEVDKETTPPPKVQCPFCWKNNAFDAKKPLISMLTCHLLQELEKSLLSQECADSGNPGLVEPRSHDDCQQTRVQQEQQQQSDHQPSIDNDSSIIRMLSGDMGVFDIPRNENDEMLTGDLNNLLQVHEDTIETQQQNTPYDHSPVEDHNQVYLAEALPVVDAPIAYAELLEPSVPFYVKRRRLLIALSLTLLIIPLVIVLVIKIPVNIRNKKLTSIILNLTNQSSFQALSVPERSSLVWIQGSDNFDFSPDFDRTRIAQRFIIANFFFSTFYYSIKASSSDDFITKDTDLQKRFIYAAICFSVDCSNLPLEPRDDECTWLPESLSCSVDGEIISITLGK